MAFSPENPDPGGDLADLRALQAGDDTALDRIVGRWEKPLFGFAWRYVRNTADARDLAAETLVRFYHHRSKLATDSNISAWLFKTLVNLCHNHRRWQKRHPSANLDETMNREQASEAPLPGSEMEQRETYEALSAAIDRLPHDLKVTLLLHHYEHLGYREIGIVTGCSERGVETRLYRARLRLREEMSSFMSQSTKG